MPHADDVNDQDPVGDHAGGAAVADADSAGVIGAGKERVRGVLDSVQPEGLKRNSPRATPVSLPTFRHAWIARLGGLPPAQAGLASAFTPRSAAGERLLFLYPLFPTRLSGFPSSLDSTPLQPGV